MTAIQRWLAGFAGLALAALAIYWVGRSQGYRAAEDYYKPIVQRIEERAKFEAEAAKGREAVLQERFDQSEERYARLEKALQGERDATRQRIAGLVSDISTNRFCPVREASHNPTEPSIPARVLELSGRIGAAFARVGERTKRDAIRLTECQRLLATERDILDPR